MLIKVDLNRNTIFYNDREIGHFKWGIVGQTAEVKDILILPQFRRRGIGTMVAKLLESEFRKMGCRQVEAFRVQPEMGVPFAEKLGYKTISSFGRYKHMIKAL